MQLIIFGFLLVVVTTSTIALNLQHKDLNDPTKPCGPERSTCDPKKSTNLSRNFTIRNCMCDPQCATYGDCCQDSPYFKDAEQRRAVTDFNCMPMPTDDQHSFYMKQSCPASWEDKDIRRKCEESTVVNLKYPVLMAPVTDRLNNITYGNIFCSRCHGHKIGAEYQDMWQMGFRCPHDSPIMGNHSTFLEKVNFNESNNFWQLIHNNKTVPCSFHLIIPKQAKPRLAACQQGMKKTCPATWIHGQHTRNGSTNTSSNQPSRESIRDSCESYTMIVYPQTEGTLGTPSQFSEGSSHVSYRNVHCAMCNSVQVQNIICDNPIQTKFSIITQTDVPSFTMLFDFNSIMLIDHKNCEPGQIYDVLLKICRQDVITRELRTSRKSDCPNSWNYETGEYHHENQSVAVCEIVDNKYPIYFRLISAVGVGVSIICLVAHLVAFVLLKDLRNLSGKNLASLCFALLMAYTSFVLANALENTVCVVNAVITYYFFLAAFSWMLIMSFDVWRSLKIATKELRVSSGKQWRKFFIYSACGWLVPAKFVLVALLVDFCPMGEFGQRFQPNFGRKACWFNNGQSLLLFFILPVFITLLCNVSFFIFSAVMIYSSHSMTRYSASPATKRDFRLYARLSLIMGLTWITGLVAGLADNRVMWVLFIISNAFLGLFIFLAFTWRKAVLHGLKNLKRDSVLNLPAFSWSVNSSSSIDTAGKSQTRDDRRTSNTYY